MKEEVIQAYAIADESGMLGNFNCGDEVHFFRTRRAATKERNKINKMLGKDAYIVREIIITAPLSN